MEEGVGDIDGDGEPAKGEAEELGVVQVFAAEAKGDEDLQSGSDVREETDS